MRMISHQVWKRGFLCSLLRGTSILASIGLFDMEARERRKVLGVQRGKHEMVRECCGADEAIQHLPHRDSDGSVQTMPELCGKSPL
jgi:hypothetical protein